MAATQCTCPECNLKFKAPQGAQDWINCPICDTRFPAPSADQADDSASGFSLGGVLQGIGLFAALGSLVGGIILGVALFTGKKAPPSTAAVALERRPSPPPTVPDRASPPPTERRPLPPPEPPPPPPPPVLTEEQRKINESIDRGIAYLKLQLDAATRRSPPMDWGPVYNRANTSLGSIALMGLTLLACGTPAQDPVVQQAAKAVRSAEKQLSYTYSLSLALLFLDRLEDPRDRELIRTFALRLVAGQNQKGDWGYSCPLLAASAEEPIVTYLKSRPTLVSVSPREVKKLGRVEAFTGLGPGDNSNTQFAVLALWAAQRHDLPVEPSLVLVDKYFRDTQAPAGSWGYAAGSPSWKSSMTCAGLLALAVGRGIVHKADASRAPARDDAVEKGFRYLTQTIDNPNAPRGGNRLIHADSHGDLYYLWSLERVAMVYDLKTIGGKDWYAWASKVIVAAQQTDGSWQDAFPGPADTCFALLVLKKVNVAQDLTTYVKKAINIKEVESAQQPDGVEGK